MRINSLCICKTFRFVLSKHIFQLTYAFIWSLHSIRMVFMQQQPTYQNIECTQSILNREAEKKEHSRAIGMMSNNVSSFIHSLHRITLHQIDSVSIDILCCSRQPGHFACAIPPSPSFSSTSSFSFTFFLACCIHIQFFMVIFSPYRIFAHVCTYQLDTDTLLKTIGSVGAMNAKIITTKT